MIATRPATDPDLPAISAIYNHYIRTSTATYQVEPETLDERREWFNDHGERYPAVVAEDDGEVVGWGALSPFRNRFGYRFTVEASVYVRHDCHRQGIGRALLADLIDRARLLGYHTLIGGASADQTASLALQESLGFTTVAHFREVGHKFDRWLDVVFMQLML
jgi:L-amino acid N-acyltransferase YncA